MKAIYMNELAQQYFPHSNKYSAVTQLRRWRVLCTPLQHRLEELYFHKGQRALTPKQYEAIAEYLGEPGDYKMARQKNICRAILS